MLWLGPLAQEVQRGGSEVQFQSAHRLERVFREGRPNLQLLCDRQLGIDGMVPEGFSTEAGKRHTHLC